MKHSVLRDLTDAKSDAFAKISNTYLNYLSEKLKYCNNINNYTN